MKWNLQELGLELSDVSSVQAVRSKPSRGTSMAYAGARILSMLWRKPLILGRLWETTLIIPIMIVLCVLQVMSGSCRRSVDGELEVAQIADFGSLSSSLWKQVSESGF